jgi:hypothetical protein
MAKNSACIEQLGVQVMQNWPTGAAAKSQRCFRFNLRIFCGLRLQAVEWTAVLWAANERCAGIWPVRLALSLCA